MEAGRISDGTNPSSSESVTSVTAPSDPPIETPFKRGTKVAVTPVTLQSPAYDWGALWVMADHSFIDREGRDQR